MVIIPEPELADIEIGSGVTDGITGEHGVVGGQIADSLFDVRGLRLDQGLMNSWDGVG